MLTLLALVGCIWVDQTEYIDMRDGLLDGDADGFQSLAEGGNDCDDTDPAVHPGATETWYDGVDSDCAGDDDYDRDGDGAAAQAYGGGDCDDGDADVAVDVQEIWYDGLDQDCDGGNDYDADGDGHTSDQHSGDDCDDTQASAYPGGTEVWYDGIDGDCDGGDDYDADGDGFAQGTGPGEDCADDTNTIHPHATEHIGDAVDTDCDGGVDSFGFPFTSTMAISGVQGPVVKMSDREISVGYAAEEIVDPLDGYTVYDSLSVVAFGPKVFHEGPTLDWPYGFESSSGTMGDQFDFWSDGNHYVWGSTLYKPGSARRFLYLDAIDFTAPANADTASYQLTDALYDWPYTDIDLFVGADDRISLLACESGSGSLAIVQDTVADFVPAGTPSVEAFVAEPTSLCEVADGEGSVWFTRPGEVGLQEGQVDVSEGQWNPGGPIDIGGGVDQWTVVDVEVGVFHDEIWTLVVDLVEGLYVRNTQEFELIQPMGAGMVQADLGADDDGRAFVCAVSDTGKLRFWHGVPGAMEELSLDPGLTTVEQCGVASSKEGLVVLAVRGDDQLVIGGVYASDGKP